MKLLAPLGLALSLIASAAFAAQPVTINNAQNSDSVTVTNHKLDVNATTTVGSFQPSSSGSRMTPLSVTTSDSSGTLPTGAQNIIFNTDTTNPIYCNEVGVAATTSDAKIPANSWLEFTPKAAVTTLHCIATGGTVTANGLGGSGLATGSGGGGGGSGGATNATIVGPIGTGAPAVGVTTTLDTTDAAALQSIITNTSGATPAGTNLIGKVGIDQTTPGTTNGVQANAGTNLNTSLLATDAHLTALGTSALVTDSHFTTALGTGSLFSTMAAGSTPTNGIGVLGEYLSGGETLTNTQTSALMLDANGYMEVNVKAGSTGNAAASATGSTVPTSGDFIAGGAAGGTGNLTGATVKAPSTAAVATDTALVVAISPNNTLTTAPGLPAGSTYQAGSAAAVSTTGAQTMVATPGSGHALFGSVLSCGNSSATGTFVTFNDAHTLQIYVPPTYGNNIIMTLPSTIQWASNTAATFATVTSVNEVICNFVGYSI